MTRFQQNLRAFKDLIERYTIADLKSMIYDVEIKNSGACCYPAVQTLFSLMELLGRLRRQNVSDQESFCSIFVKLGSDYSKSIGKYLYEYFRNGIAHTSLAKAGVWVKKEGDKNFHLSNEGKNIDIKIMFQDFLVFFNKFFDQELVKSEKQSYYEANLKDLFKQLNLSWIPTATGDLDVSADYSRTYVSLSSTTKVTSFSNNFKGVIIEESLADKSVLSKIKIEKTRIEQVTKKHKTPWLKHWTLHTVEVAGEEAYVIAQEISRSFDYSHKSAWYADFKSDKYHYIIYKDKIFKIDRGKPEEYRAATDYGISLGIPDYQVDFSPFINIWKR